jgi:transposase
VRTVAEEYDRVVGVDTHAATHTMTLLIGATGAVVEHRTFPTSAAGLRRALTWIRNRTQDQACLVVVEGTGSYGAGLAEHFTQGGIVVAEAPTIPAARPRGKDDAMDSARIARAVLGLRLDQLCWPRAGGTRTAIRVLVSARDQMGTERTKIINALTALVRSVDLGVDARKALTSAQITTIAGWRARDEDPAVPTCRREAIRLASRIHALGRTWPPTWPSCASSQQQRFPSCWTCPGSALSWPAPSCSPGPTPAGCAPKPPSPRSPEPAPSPHPQATPSDIG